MSMSVEFKSDLLVALLLSVLSQEKSPNKMKIIKIFRSIKITAYGCNLAQAEFH